MTPFSFFSLFLFVCFVFETEPHKVIASLKLAT